MRSIVAFPFLAAALAVSQVSAGTAAFDPPVAVVSQGETADFLVSITSTGFPAFEGVDMDFTDEFGTYFEPPILDLSFTYAQSFLASTTLPPMPPGPSCGITGACWLWVSGFNNNTWTVTEDLPLLVGKFSVDTANLAAGSYDILVNSDLELEFGGASFSGISYVGGMEGLYGQATLVVVPEPTTISLLVLAGLCIIRRQRSRPGA